MQCQMWMKWNGIWFGHIWSAFEFEFGWQKVISDLGSHFGIQRKYIVMLSE